MRFFGRPILPRYNLSATARSAGHHSLTAEIGRNNRYVRSHPPWKRLRRQMIRYLAVLLFVSVMVPVAQAEQVSPYVRYRLEILAPGDLKESIAASLDLMRWQDYPNITPELLAQLARQGVDEAREALAAEGYFSPVVSVNVDEGDPERVVQLTVVPGEPTRVSSVEIRFSGAIATEGPDSAARTSRIRKQWSLRKGLIFRQSDWDAAKAGAREQLAGISYVAARIASSEARVDPDRHEAALSLELDSGPPVHFGEIVVRGEAKYSPDRVRELAPFQKGELYSEEMLDRFQRRLAATGYFASLQVNIDQNPELADAATVTVAVIEAPAKRIELGLGYSTDTLYRATASWRDNNFNQDGWRIRNDARLESKIQSATTVLDLPERSGNLDSINAKAERSEIQDLTTEEFSFGMQRKGLDEHDQPQYGARYVRERQQAQGAPSDVTYATYIDYQHSWRDTDDLISPRKGLITQLELGVAPNGVSTRTFGRLIGRLAWFEPLARNTDFVAKLQAGTVIAPASSGIPQDMLFRTGGDTTVRGYAFESLGVQQGKTTLGGRYFAVANAEAIQWIGDGVGIAAFVDAGNAADSGKDLEPKIGYGLGVRARSPIGVFRLDIAYGVDAHQLRLHFSAGLTF